jgi:hypothetical protein
MAQRLEIVSETRCFDHQLVFHIIL